MKKWYVKELSRKTNVSVRTLHYYDKIGLLKPSNRLDNGYRVYSEEDVRKLEQVIVLKFFGFTLARIKQIITNQEYTLPQLETQLILLQSEVSFLQEIQRKLLLNSIKEYKKKSSIDWHNLLELINTSIKTSKEITHQSTQDADMWHKLLSKITSNKNDSTVL